MVHVCVHVYVHVCVCMCVCMVDVFGMSSIMHTLPIVHTYLMHCPTSRSM